MNINMEINLTQEELACIISDLRELSDERIGAARNEHLWALGSKGQSESINHEHFADVNCAIAAFYEDLYRALEGGDE